VTVGTDLAELARRAAGELDTAPASEIVRWAVRTFGTRLVVTSSMQDAVLVHLAGQLAPGIDVLFLDTGYHFPETLGTRDAVAATYPVNLITVRPGLSVAEQDAAYGPKLYERDPDRCCRLRKVLPLDHALQGYDAWLTGLRRADSPDRSATPVVSYDSRRGKVRIAPLATWTDADVSSYISTHRILTNPLLAAGYSSVGCAPCTRAVAAWEHPRAGRWAGLTKTECGIHQ
jgi:phosphoadenosine phosphosulfate reductase